MADRLFRLVLGVALLIALYVDLDEVITGVIAYLLFEGVTNLRLAWILANTQLSSGSSSSVLTLPEPGLDAERVLRLIIACLLAASHLVWPQALWFLPWFIAFALMGAGLSGLCPMVLLLRGMGLR